MDNQKKKGNIVSTIIGFSILFAIIAAVVYYMVFYSHAFSDLTFSISSDETYYSVSIAGDKKDGIKDVDIPSKHKGLPVKEIRESGFSNCPNLEEVNIPDSVTTVGAYAFANCPKLVKVNNVGSINSVGEEAFLNCIVLEEITLSAQTEFIAVDAFENCPLLNCEYYGGYYLRSGNNPYFALIRCEESKLENLTFTTHSNTKIIMSSAFEKCPALERLCVLDNVSKILSGAFETSQNLNEIVVSTNNRKYKSVDNCLIEIESKTLILGCHNSIIPMDGMVEHIGDMAFDGCHHMSNIEIPNSVKSISVSAFSGCSSLTDISFVGTKEEWERVEKGEEWDKSLENYTIYCTDGTIAKDGTET